MTYGIFLLVLVILVVGLGQDVLREVAVRLAWKAAPPFSVGDSVRIGTYSGTVSRMGWTRVHLCDGSGDLLLLSNTQVLRSAVVGAASGSRSFPVRLSIPLDAEVEPHLALEAGREAVQVSPYLALDRPVRVTLEYQAGGRMAVAIHAGVFAGGPRDEFTNSVIESLHQYLLEQRAESSPA